MPQDLDALLAGVHDERSFIEFIVALAADFTEEKEIESKTPSTPYSSGALGWENGAIDQCLGAAAAWGMATLLAGKSGSPSQNSWHRCAAILYAGKFYE